MNQLTKPKQKIEHGCDDWDDIYPLERLRKERTKLTQVQFARAVNIKPSTYQKWITYKKTPKTNPTQQKGILSILQLTFDEYWDLFKDYED